MINDLDDFEKRVAQISHREAYQDDGDELSGMFVFLVTALFVVLAAWGAREYRWHNRFMAAPAHESCILSKSEELEKRK